MRTLGIAGTAKNTGKTTALNALVAEARRRGVGVALTSIGYDGEAVDNVTGLPKPRVVVHPGTVVTTARSCLGDAGVGGAPRRGAPRWEILEGTGVATPLGEVVVARARAGGPVVLAGPNKRHELLGVVERLAALGAELALVDGALNRLAPMSAAGGLLLATGAARHPDVERLAGETRALEALFALPAVAPTGEGAVDSITTPFPAAEEMAAAATGRVGQGGARRSLRLRGPVAPGEMARLARDPGFVAEVSRLVFPDPVALVLGGDPLAMAAAVEALHRAGVEVAVDRPLPLVAVTVNPFHPRFDGHGYHADAVPAADLRDAVGAALRTPVLDVVLDGPEALWRVVVASASEPAGARLP